MRQHLHTVLFALGVHGLIGCGAGAGSTEMDEGNAATAHQAARRNDEPPDFPPDDDPPPPPPPPPSPPSVTQIASKFQNYDINGDGTYEIETLNWLPGHENNPNATKGRVLVLYDPRMFAGTEGLALRIQLALMRTDMYKEGYQPMFLETKVYRGPRHQDGRTVLALRRMVKAIHEVYPLRSLVLVGDYPEASIVRRALVRSRVGAEPRTFGNQQFTNTDFVETITHVVAPRSDLVLGDMDGDWENIYHEAETVYHDVQMVPHLPSGTNFPVPGQVLTSTHYNDIEQRVADYFYIDDQDATYAQAGGVANLTIYSLAEPGLELSAADRAAKNPIARPEITVSRINARHVALTPYLRAARAKDHGGPLGNDGKPRVIRLTGPDEVLYKEDPDLERRVLGDYLYRIHAFRLGGDSNKPFRTAAVRALDSGLMSPSSFNNILRKAHGSFSTSIATDDTTLLDYVNWLKTPATLRGIAAHSNASGAVFGPSHPYLVNNAVGWKPWKWVLNADADGQFLEPSLGAPNGTATADWSDWAMYRTLWENNVYTSLNRGQSFYMHDGCEVNTVPWDKPYSYPGYAAGQHAESLLFFGNGLAIVSRAKVFNDTPRGFTEAISSTGRFADGWQSYFDADRNDASLNPAGTTNWENRRTRTLQRKRTYFWGLSGDPTLLIRYH